MWGCVGKALMRTDYEEELKDTSQKKCKDKEYFYSARAIYRIINLKSTSK